MLEFNTPEAQIAAAHTLKNFMRHPGWEIMREVLEANIEFKEKELGEFDGSSQDPAMALRQIQHLQDRIKDMKALRDWPEKMMGQFSQGQIKEPTDADPYEKESP